ncbi:hypothetical protein ABZS63_28115, partial [Streptomyces sp. NPDC005568]
VEADLFPGWLQPIVSASPATFVVAHRLSAIRDADRIVMMRDGEMREIGSHEELLGRDGAYPALHG